MRVVMVCGFGLSPKATVSARAVPMARALMDCHHDVTILSSPYDNLAFSGQQLREDGVPIKNLEIRGRSTFRLMKIPLDFLRHISVGEPDIIHIFKPKGFSGMTAMLLHLLRRWPFVLDHDDWEGWGGWNEISPYSKSVKHFINFQEAWIPRKAQAITVASRLLEERLLDSKIPREKIFYVPNGPKQSLKNWKPPDRAETEAIRLLSGYQNKVVIWYAGHMDAVDEPLGVLEVLAEVVKRSCHAAVWVAGPVSPELKNFVRANGLSHEITFLGWIPYDCYLRYLAASDIVFYPFPDTPIYRAKCSGKVIEYMCLGKPLVTTPVGQNLEYLENGMSGIVSKDRSLQVEALARLVSDSALRETLGQNARKRVWEKFSWDGTIERVLGAYDLALSKGKITSQV